jgi:predicted glutamine amidotransferase
VESLESELSLRVRDLVRSKVVISHIRYASGGSHVPVNTHPFELPLDPRKNSVQEKSWIFAHNGTIGLSRDKLGQINDERFPLKDVRPHGSTDSEYAFCYIMEKLREAYVNNECHLAVEEKIRLIQQAANAIDDKCPKSMNFLLSDGYRIFAYYSGYDGSGGLWYVLRRPPHKNPELVDSKDGQKIFLEKSENEFAAIIATRKLTEPSETWRNFERRSMHCFEDGSLRA